MAALPKRLAVWGSPEDGGRALHVVAVLTAGAGVDVDNNNNGDLRRQTVTFALPDENYQFF